eukprot:2635062-Amphidinium_carterae.1
MPCRPACASYSSDGSVPLQFVSSTQVCVHMCALCQAGRSPSSLRSPLRSPRTASSAMPKVCALLPCLSLLMSVVLFPCPCQASSPMRSSPCTKKGSIESEEQGILMHCFVPFACGSFIFLDA